MIRVTLIRPTHKSYDLAHTSLNRFSIRENASKSAMERLRGGKRGWVKVVFSDGDVILLPFDELKIT
jgi:hypothetical protein